MNYTKLFYWLTVADNARSLFIVAMIVFTVIFVIAFMVFLIDRDGNDFSADKDGAAERAKRWVWWAGPFALFFWMLFVMTPSKKDALLIVAGGQTLNYLTNDSTARQLPKEALNFVVTELKSMAKDAEVQIDLRTQKEKILDEAKNLTAKELLEKMKVDTTFARIILDK
jgi:hypothetical protein